ncbi:MAG: flippase-like domain-containing protein [Burkholderiales bacterium]|nr:flippase-like domain-containing protein [Burkholderiales bacterium]
MTFVQRMLAPVALLFGVGVLLYAGALMWAGSRETLLAAERIGWGTIAAGTLLACTGFVARFARWHSVLTWLGHRLPPWFGFRVYLAGFALTLSPGKLGETSRSLLLLPRGVGIPASLAAFFADRLSDVIGVAALGAAASWISGSRAPVVEIVAACTFLFALLARAIVRRSRFEAALNCAQRRRRAQRWAWAIARPALAWSTVWTVPHALFCAACGLVGFGIQAWVFSMYVDATGAALGTMQCMAIFASATLLGAASMMPAGLGAMEAALIYQLVDAGVATADAMAVALTTRVSTLWCTLLLASCAMLSVAREARPEDRPCLD